MVRVSDADVLAEALCAFGEITTNALEAASIVLSPIDMKSAVNVESVTDLDEHMAALSRRAPVFFLPNKWVKQETECREALVRAQQACGKRLLLSAVMPQSTAVPQAMSRGRALSACREGAAQLAQAVWALAQFVVANAEQRELPAAGGA